jgi:hypothetical protein
VHGITSVPPDKVGLSVQRNPLVWALPLQAILLLSNLDLLDPWGDEWDTLTTVLQPLNDVVSTDPMHPPLYYLLLHYWIRLPWTVTPLVSMRAMSVAWTLLATVVIYFLWLRREGARFQAMFLALWVLSPCLLLHSPMARSYSMELALASLAIFAALEWAKESGDCLPVRCFKRRGPELVVGGNCILEKSDQDATLKREYSAALA